MPLAVSAVQTVKGTEYQWLAHKMRSAVQCRIDTAAAV